MFLREEVSIFQFNLELEQQHKTITYFLHIIFVGFFLFSSAYCITILLRE